MVPGNRRRHRRPQRVLVVDDSKDIRELWRLWLTFWNFSVEEAGNGHEAVQKALLHTPDLILLDLWMPVVDGVEALKRLKGDARTAGIPVLAMSAQSSAPDAPTVIAAGADALLAKPSDPDVLLDHIRAAMRRLHA
jgi:CheY-like chemotaxis protein